MASFTPNCHSTRPLVSLFLLVLAAFVSAASSQVYDAYVIPRDKLDSKEAKNIYFEDMCIDARDKRACRRVLATIPELEYKLEAKEFAALIPHVIASRTVEAKALAAPLLDVAEKNGGEMPKCLADCAASLDEVSKAISGLPTEVKEYTKVQSFLRKKFEAGATPPLCKSGCPDKSCTTEEAAVANKFHSIWALMDSVEPYARYMGP